MKKFGSAISYITADLIRLCKSCDKENYIEKRDRYLAAENQPEGSFYHRLGFDEMMKIAGFVDRYLDSVTCENEMKMGTCINRGQPVFINDEVNTDLFNFSCADRVYTFAQENELDIRLHTIVWYRHFPGQLAEYLENRTAEDRKKLTLAFIREYMQCLRDRYPNAYCVDVINEMAADPDEIRICQEEGLPVYAHDDEGIRIDDWYRLLGKHYYIDVFRLAREVFGDHVKLFYNDNNEGNREKQRTIKTVVDQIRQYEQEHHVKLLDGFGMQSHFWGSEDETKAYMEEAFSFYTGLGVEIQITEFDVCNHSTRAIQNAIFRDFIEVAQNFGIEVFTTWGLNDTLSWLHDDEASLIDAHGDFKPFTQRYIDTFSNKYQKTLLSKPGN